MHLNLIARAGLASMPLTAFAPAARAGLTGYGTPWLLLPVGSVVAFIGGTCAEKRAASTRRRGVVVSDPPPAEDGVAYAVAPRDEIRIDYAWSNEAA